MATAQTSSTKLNPIQVSLLRLFNRPMSESQILTLQKLLVSHYSVLLQEEVTKVVNEKGYTQKDFDDMLNERHDKTPNADTVAAMDELKAGKGKEFKSVEDLLIAFDI